MIGAVTDITERKRTEEALAQSQERYRSIKSAVNDGIYDQNLLTGETYLSRRWKGILGYADDEIPNLELAFRDFVHPDDRAAIAKVAGEYLESKQNKSHTLDFRVRHKNGGYRWVHSRGKVRRREPPDPGARRNDGHNRAQAGREGAGAANRESRPASPSGRRNSLAKCAGVSKPKPSSRRSRRWRRSAN